MGTENLPCNLNKSDQLAVNISVGADHFIRVWDGADVVDTCAEPFGPNTLPTFQGISGGLFGGMITGETVNGTFFEGRLGKGTTAKLALKQNNNYYYVDNVPLWEYIGYGKTGLAPLSCPRESFDDIVKLPDGYENAEARPATCLTDYAAGYVDLFDLDTDGDDVFDIVGSPRYRVVPQFVEQGFPSGGSGNLHISGFRAVFVNGLYFGCDGTDCSLVVTPGATTGQVTLPNGSSPLDQITGYLLPNAALPDDLIENGVNGELAAYAVRLSG